MHISKSLFVFIYLKLLVLFIDIFVGQSLLFLLLLCVWFSVYDLVESSYRVNKHDARYVLCQREVRDEQDRESKLEFLLLLLAH